MSNLFDLFHMWTPPLLMHFQNGKKNYALLYEGLVELANYCIDESNSKVGHSKDDKKCRHDEISEVKTHLYLFRSLALKVILKKEQL